MSDDLNPHRVEVDGCSIRRCPIEWTNLLPTEDSDVKFCAVCWRNVHLARTADELKLFATEGKCVAYESTAGQLLGYAILPKTPLEHTNAELLAAVTKHREGTASVDDLRFITHSFLKARERNESLQYIRIFLDAGGIPDLEMIQLANRIGVDATDPAPSKQPRPGLGPVAPEREGEDRRHDGKHQPRGQGS